MDNLVIAQALKQSELFAKDNKFVYLKHKLYKFGKKTSAYTPKWLVDKWAHISPILASDIGIKQKGVKTLFKVPLNEYESLLNELDDYNYHWRYCKGHTPISFECDCEKG